MESFILSNGKSNGVDTVLEVKKSDEQSDTNSNKEDDSLPSNLENNINEVNAS